MLINKETIISAIDQEPLLAAGNFGDHLTKGCTVCAVGAVLRRVRAPADASNHVTGDCYTERDYVSPAFFLGTPLGQISAAFEFAFTESVLEGFTEEAAIELARFHAMLIAEAFCPPYVEVNLPIRKASK